MKLSSTVFTLTLTVASILHGHAANANDVEDPSMSPFNQNTCTAANKNCPNACDNANDGSTCCFCDNTKNYQMSICSCCPKNSVCCPPTTDTNTRGSLCCPKGSTCLKNGKCQIIQEELAVYARPVCSPTCQKDAYMLFTCDNYGHVYFDGEPQKLSNPGDWTKAERLNIPSSTEVICFAGENTEYEAGFLCEFYNSGFDTDNAVCTGVPPVDEKWLKADFDDSNWSPAVRSEPNVPRKEGWQREKVQGMLETTFWFWCNKGTTTRPTKTVSIPWKQFAFCRIKRRE